MLQYNSINYTLEENGFPTHNPYENTNLHQIPLKFNELFDSIQKNRNLLQNLEDEYAKQLEHRNIIENSIAFCFKDSEFFELTKKCHELCQESVQNRKLKKESLKEELVLFGKKEKLYYEYLLTQHGIEMPTSDIKFSEETMEETSKQLLIHFQKEENVIPLESASLEICVNCGKYLRDIRLLENCVHGEEIAKCTCSRLNSYLSCATCVFNQCYGEWKEKLNGFDGKSLPSCIVSCSHCHGGFCPFDIRIMKFFEPTTQNLFQEQMNEMLVILKEVMVQHGKILEGLSTVLIKNTGLVTKKRKIDDYPEEGEKTSSSVNNSSLNNRYWNIHHYNNTELESNHTPLTMDDMDTIGEYLNNGTPEETLEGEENVPEKGKRKCKKCGGRGHYTKTCKVLERTEN